LYVNDMQEDQFEGLATKLAAIATEQAAKNGMPGPEVARILPLWKETTRSPGVLKELLGKKSKYKILEEVTQGIENEARKCVKNHLASRPYDEKALRLLAKVAYEEGVREVDLLDFMPAKGRGPSGPSDDFFMARAVTTDTKKFRFTTVAAHTQAKKHFQQKDMQVVLTDKVILK
jgi:hypothetical protein